MKKWISALTAAALLIALIGCASDTPAQTSERKKKKTSVTTELTQPVQSGEITTEQSPLTTTAPNLPPDQMNELEYYLSQGDEEYYSGDYYNDPPTGAYWNYKHALQIDPTSQRAKDGLEKVLNLLQDEFLTRFNIVLSIRDYEGAREMLMDAYLNVPELSDLCDEKLELIEYREIQDPIDDANKLADAGDWDGAQKALEDLIAKNPTNKTVNEAYNDLLNRMPITLKNITTISSDCISVVKDVVKDRYGNIYDGGVKYDFSYGSNEAFGLYNLSGKYTVFKATAFPTIGSYNNEKTSIAIYLDEELVWFKDEITNETAPIDISINLTGKKTMRIKMIGDRNVDIFFGNSSFEKVSQESTQQQPANP